MLLTGQLLRRLLRRQLLLLILLLPSSPFEWRDFWVCLQIVSRVEGCLEGLSGVTRFLSTIEHSFPQLLFRLPLVHKEEEDAEKDAS